MRKIFLFMVLMTSVFCIEAQTTQSRYPMVFRFKTDSIHVKDTSLTVFQLDYWRKSSQFPSKLQWKSTNFQLKKNVVDSLQLCSDSVSSFSSGDIIGYAFYKIANSGTFRFDYKITNIGRYILNSSSPNVDVLQTPQGIQLKAHGHINANTPLTVDYSDLINLFPSDPTVELINY